MLGSLGWEELLIILVIVALLLGASRVGALGGAIGRGIREFRSEASRPTTPAPDEQQPAAPSTESTRTG
jgi:sec-independent protein translocase protein TatA